MAQPISKFYKATPKPEPKCERLVVWKGHLFRCDLPKEHLPATEHATTLRWDERRG